MFDKDDQQMISRPVLGYESPAEKRAEVIEGAVFLPVHAVASPGCATYAETRVLADGATALFAYSSLSTLVNCCGEQQAWAAVKSRELSEIQAGSEVDVVLWDTQLPEQLRRDAEND
ncbi:hypothetical protein DMC61_14655 [Amycolatopsis sp. WAC 04169]|nr:hypothetical protein DMC61_14655 [Amycolatopsis sp. WAC 04169]